MFLQNKDNDVINTINYMSKTGSGTFIGFFPISGNYCTWGVEINEQYCCAVYLMEETTRNVSDHQDLENLYISVGLDLPVLFYGSDNTSYIMRFKDAEDAYSWLRENESFNALETDGACYYNS